MNVQSALSARVERVRSIDGGREKFARRSVTGRACRAMRAVGV